MLDTIVTGDDGVGIFCAGRIYSAQSAPPPETLAPRLIAQKRRPFEAQGEQDRRTPRLAGLGFGLLGGLGCYGLIDLEEGHFQFAEKVEEKGIFLGG